MVLNESQCQRIYLFDHVNTDFVMSQKYKSFSKGRSSDFGSALPPGVKRIGYLRKLKKLKKRFFVLHMESNYGVARLEYYSSEKKWRFGCEPRRCIELKSCLNISRKLHSKQKNVIAFYTRDDCFAIVADTSEEFEDWLKDILEVHKNSLDIDENSRNRIVYEHLWQVIIDKHDLEYDKLLAGPYRVALTPKSLYLIKMNPLGENDYLEFPLMSIRRCGHSKDHFFIELGRSAVTGAGEIYMATEATIVAQNMHETVLSAMKSSKIREDPLPRPRSASSSENSNPIPTSRPIGIVAPQTVSSASCSGFSNSRERCDSLPTRPQTIVGSSYNFALSSLSSPYTSNNNISRELNSRPHSMYEWPSLNSPLMRNSIFSPNSLSGCGSSTEEMDNIKQQSLNYYPHCLTVDGSSSSRSITEVKEQYLKMSPSAEKTAPLEYMSLKRSNEVALIPSDYMDMKPSTTPTSGSLKKTATNYMPMAAGGASDEVPIVMQAGYIDMSPSNSLPNSISNSHSLERSNIHHNRKNEVQHSKSFELEKVLSLLQVKDSGNKNSTNATFKYKPSVFVHDTNFTPTSLCDTQSKSFVCVENSVFAPCINISKEEAVTTSKPPIPERTYIKNECKNNVCPPLPLRKAVDNKIVEHTKGGRDSVKVTDAKSELIPHLQKKRSNLDELDVFYDNSVSVDTRSITHLQNTNLNSPSNSIKNKTNVLCTSPYTSTKIPQGVEQNKANNKFKKSEHDYIDDVNKNRRLSNSDSACDNMEFQLNCDPALVKNTYTEETIQSESMHSGDYVNIDLEKKDCTSSILLSLGNMHKINPLSLPPPYLSDPNYSNIQFGKPICPLPNPILASSENMSPAFNNSAKCDGNFLQSSNPSAGSVIKHEDLKLQNVLKSPLASTGLPKNVALIPKFRNIPNTLPAFRKQMSAPAGPLSLRPELPSPGRKSSCPVTGSSSMIKPPLPPAYISPIRPMHLQSHGATSAHLKVTVSRSPDHSSVSSISSASDEISSTHSSPKTLSTSQNFSAIGQQTVSDSQYENVVIPQRPSTSSRPPSVSSEKELNYASLDLAPSTKEVPRSPTILNPLIPDKEESLTYAEIDFTKSEGLKNTSGSLREGRL